MSPKKTEWLLTSSLMLLVATACVGWMNRSSGSTEQPTVAPLSPTAIPSTQELAVTLTPSPTVTPIPYCPPQTSESISVVSMAVYNNVNTGLNLGPWEAIGLLQQALEGEHANWANYTYEGSDGDKHSFAYYFWNTSNAQFIGVNPKVFLVTSGIALDWRVPADEDLRDAVDQVGVELNEHYRAYRFSEEVQRKHPEVENASSYALYAFFDYDPEAVQQWCKTYIDLFEESPLVVPSYDRNE